MEKYVVEFSDTVELDQRIKFIESVRDVVSVTKYREGYGLVPMVRTGVLVLPYGCTLSVDQSEYLSGDTVNLNEYPEFEKFCTDIKDEFSFENIAEKEAIEIVVVGKFSNHDEKYVYLCNGKILKGNIKSIRIIERAKS